MTMNNNADSNDNNLSIEDVIEIYNSQNKECALNQRITYLL